MPLANDQPLLYKYVPNLTLLKQFKIQNVYQQHKMSQNIFKIL